ncbi:MAG: protein kinase [Ignavibacteriae bacterium]|nr:protein kinase [Ignavibacteriota bacterium]
MENIEQDIKDIPLKWNIGDFIADLYEVTGVLGEGGMGIVYKVHHKEWDVDLAVKSIRPEILNNTGLENFIKEAETWVNLGLHPNIVSCYYVRKLGEVPRIFSEYVDGGSLKEWIQTGKLYEGRKEEVLERILDIAIQSAWGLKYAHEQGLIHQDVKPANILMSSDGSVKVTDFGIAKVKKKSDIISQTYNDPNKSVLVSSGSMTPAYCSPEQKEGKPLSRRTDIWSWAVSILEMFTGGVHWVSGTVAETILEQHLINGCENINIPNIPDQLAELLIQCFQYNPEDRPNDFEEISKRLFDIYSEIHNSKYYRTTPKSADLLADSLNNKAISFLDLEKFDKAEECWKEALRINPQHLQSNFNYNYFHWGIGNISGDNLVKQLEAIKLNYLDNIDYWLCLGWIYYELGDVDAINEIQNSKYRIKDKKFNDTLNDKDQPIGKEIRKFTEDDDDVRTVCFSPDGKYVLSGSDDCNIRLWDIQSGNKIRTYIGHSGSIHSVCFSPDGKNALSGSYDCEIRLWDIQTGETSRVFKGHTRSVHSVCFSPDGKYALSGSNDYTVRLWDIQSGKEIKKFNGHTDNINVVLISPNGKYILSGSDDTTLRSWDIETGKEIKTIEIDGEKVLFLKFTENNNIAISASKDNTIIFWDILNGEKIRSIKGSDNLLSSLTISPNNTYVLSGSVDSNIYFWEVSSLKEIKTFEGHKDSIKFLSYSQDSRYVLSGSGDNSFYLWEIHYPQKKIDNNYPLLSKIKSVTELIEIENVNKEQLEEIKNLRNRKKYIEAYDLIESLQNSPYLEKSNELLNIKNDICKQSGFRRIRLKNVFCVNIFRGHTDRIYSVDFSCDNKKALSGSRDKTIRLWDIETGKEIRRFEGHTGEVISVEFSPDGRYALSGSKDNTIRLWEIETGKEIRRFDGHTESVWSVCFSPDGKFLLSGSLDNTIRLWNVDTGQEIRIFTGHTDEVMSVCFSPDGRYALSGSSDETIRLWDISTGKIKNIFEGHEQTVFSVTFSPNGRSILTGSLDKSVRFWDTSTCKEMKKIFLNYVLSALYSPDGKYALFVNTDKTFNIWDVSLYKEIGKFNGHNSAVISTVYSNDGRYILSGSFDKTMYLWEFDWDWEFVAHSDWNEDARPYLEIFLELHRDYGTDGISKVGMSNWGDDDFSNFYVDLQNRGLGYIRPERIKAELENMKRVYYNIFDNISSIKNTENHFNDNQLIQLSNVTSNSFNKILLKAQYEFDNNKLKESYFTITEALNIKEETYSNKLLSLYYKIGKKGIKKGLKSLSLVKSFEGHKKSINSVCFTSCGKFIVSGSNDNTIKLWNCESGECIRTFEGHQDAVKSICVSPNGNLILSGSRDNTTKLWDINSGLCIKTFNEHTDSVQNVYFSPKGEYAFSLTSDYQLNIIDMSLSKCTIKIDSKSKHISCVSISPDGKYFLSNDLEIKMIASNFFRHINIIQRNDTVYSSVCFSPNMKYVLSGSDEIILYDIKSNINRKYPNNPFDEISTVCFSPNSNYFITGSKDKSIKLWGISNDKVIETVYGHNREINTVCFSPDGNYIISGSDGRTIKLWQLIWEYEIPEPADWNEGVRPYLEIFLERNRRYDSGILTKIGKPVWNNKEFNMFYEDLQNRDFGWLRKDGVRAELGKMTRDLNVD